LTLHPTIASYFPAKLELDCKLVIPGKILFFFSVKEKTDTEANGMSIYLLIFPVLY